MTTHTAEQTAWNSTRLSPRMLWGGWQKRTSTQQLPPAEHIACCFAHLLISLKWFFALQLIVDNAVPIRSYRVQ